MLRVNALAIDACDLTRVITTRRLSCGLAHFTGTSPTNKEIGTAITRLGSGTTFLAIAGIGGDWRGVQLKRVRGGSWANSLRN
jgi:hypothetical protein